MRAARISSPRGKAPAAAVRCCFNGHTDVIPVGNGEGWSDNPWSAKVKEGRIYGRGSCDMKSGVASHILAVELLKAAGMKLKGDVMIDIVIDEESAVMARSTR